MSRQTLPAPRPLKRTEAAALTQLVNSAYRGESSEKGWTTESHLLGGQRIDEAQATLLAEATLHSDDTQVLVWPHADGSLEACVLLERHGDKAYLGMLTVNPLRQNGGWGREMLSQSENWVAREWQSKAIEMTVISVRQELIAWYERRGYRQTGEIRPFPMTDERFGMPKVDHLEFVVLEKTLK